MRKLSFYAVMVAGALSLGACSDDPTGGEGTGRLRVNLTDAPGDLKEAFVKVDKIILLRRDADSTSTDSTSSNRIVIEPDVDEFVNLLELTGGKVLELADTAGIPEGTYSQLRIVISEAYVRLNDDRVFATSGADLPDGVTRAGTLQCPSCSSSGFKVKFTGAGLVVNGTSTVTIDFDAGQSFGHEAGNSGRWILKPVLRASATSVSLARIRGNVALAAGLVIPSCGGQTNTLKAFKPLAIAAADTIAGATDTAGVYKITGVPAGTYAVSFAKDVTFTNGDSLTFAATATPGSVTVAAGDSATANYQVTAATCH